MAMSVSRSNVTARAIELRRAFDRSFAEPIRNDTTLQEALLAIRVGAQSCALRLSEITGLIADKKITPVPGSSAALRGIAGFRGTILPVYDLQILLGHAGSKTPRWLVIAAAAPVALAFEGFERQLRVSRDAILRHATRAETMSYAREFVRTENFTGPIMHLPSILDAIEALRFEAAPNAE